MATTAHPTQRIVHMHEEVVVKVDVDCAEHIDTEDETFNAIQTKSKIGNF